MKNAIFLGSRTHVYTTAITLGVEFSRIYAYRGSHLAKLLLAQEIPFTPFELKDKSEVLEALYTIDFDLLISNGCPILFPVEKFKPHQILLNIHPTYLPQLRGKTPINGIYYLEYEYYGATMHYINNGVDTGRIIHQEKVDLTPDLDLGLLYYLSLKLEGAVFKQGWQKLVDSNFEFEGDFQSGEGSYFNRTPDKALIDFHSMDTSLILKKIKSFGLKTQGCTCQIEEQQYLVFDAEKIIHPALLIESANIKPGKIFLQYDEKFLVKTMDGLIKIKSYKAIP